MWVRLKITFPGLEVGIWGMLRGLLRGMLRGYASGYASGPFFPEEYKAKFFGRILGTIVFERGAARLQAHFGSSSRKITTCQYKRSAQKTPWQLQLQNATFQHKRNTQSTRWQPQCAKCTLAAPVCEVHFGSSSVRSALWQLQLR